MRVAAASIRFSVAGVRRKGAAAAGTGARVPVVCDSAVFATLVQDSLNFILVYLIIFLLLCAAAAASREQGRPAIPTMNLQLRSGFFLSEMVNQGME